MTNSMLHYQSRINKEEDPYINNVNGIPNIKDITSVNILVSNYNNKHVTFSKKEYIGHFENIDEEKNSHHHENSDAHTTSSVTIIRMMSEHVEPDTFELPCYKLKPSIETRLETLLKEYKSQFLLVQHL